MSCNQDIMLKLPSRVYYKTHIKILLSFFIFSIKERCYSKFQFQCCQGAKHLFSEILPYINRENRWKRFGQKIIVNIFQQGSFHDKTTFHSHILYEIKYFATAENAAARFLEIFYVNAWF